MSLPVLRHREQFDKSFAASELANHPLEFATPADRIMRALPICVEITYDKGNLGFFSRLTERLAEDGWQSAIDPRTRTLISPLPEQAYLMFSMDGETSQEGVEVSWLLLPDEEQLKHLEKRIREINGALPRGFGPPTAPPTLG